MTQALKKKQEERGRRQEPADSPPEPLEREDEGEDDGPDDYRGDADDPGEGSGSVDDYSDKTVCVIDNGLFSEVATVLARSFGTTYLFVPWVNAYPRTIQIIVGTGLEGVTKIEDIWSVVDEVDLFVFPDVYEGPLQEHLVSLGKRVWGSRRGDRLELDRPYSKQVCEDVGLAVGPWEQVVGMDNLRDVLKDHDDRWVKISRSRGDFETFHSETYALAEPRLDEIERKLGATKNQTVFIVEESIEDAVEIGYDGFTIDGQFPTQAMSGIEIKDKGYVGRFQPYADMAPQIHEINDALAETLRGFQYRNFLSVEARITKDGTPWIIDPCARFGSPPSEVAMLMYTNLADIFWYGAEGVVVDPVPAGEWGAQVMLISGWANENWQAIDFPKKYRNHVALHFPVVIDGRYYVTPQGFDLPCIGAVCAVGKTMQAAIAKVKTIAEEVRGYYIEKPVDCFDSAEEEFAELESYTHAATEASP